MSTPNTTLADTTLVAFTGQAGTGKSTAAHYLAEAYAFEPVAFATVLKEMLERLLQAYGVDYAVLYEPHLKDLPLPALPGAPTPRRLMQTFGDAGRAVHPGLWVQALAHECGLHDLPRSAPVHDRLCVVDVRYPNEAAFVLSLGGTLYRLQRDQAAPVRVHSSELHSDDLPATGELHNHSDRLDRYFELLDGAMQQLGLEERPGPQG